MNIDLSKFCALLLVAGFATLVGCGDNGGPASPLDTDETGCHPDNSDRDCSDEDPGITSREDIEEFCELGCNSVGSMFFRDLPGVESIDGFNNIEKMGNLSIHPMDDLKTWDGFDNVTEVGRVEVTVPWVENISGFDRVEKIEQLTVTRNEKMETFDAFSNVEYVRQGDISIEDNLGVVEVGSFNNITELRVHRLMKNEILETPPNMTSLKRIDFLIIEDNPKLDQLPDFGSLQEIDQTLKVMNNGDIRECEVDALLDQLDSEPENVTLWGLSDEPCD